MSSEATKWKILISVFIIFFIAVYIVCIVSYNIQPPKVLVDNSPLYSFKDEIDPNWFFNKLMKEDNVIKDNASGCIYFLITTDKDNSLIPYYYRSYIHYPRHMGVTIDIFRMAPDGWVKKGELDYKNSFTYNKYEKVLIRVASPDIKKDTTFSTKIAVLK